METTTKATMTNITPMYPTMILGQYNRINSRQFPRTKHNHYPPPKQCPEQIQSNRNEREMSKMNPTITKTSKI